MNLNFPVCIQKVGDYRWFIT